MATGRKRHPHPALTPPRTIWKKQVSDGKVFKEKIGYEQNDDRKIVNGRLYGFHPTKGWRSCRVNQLTNYALVA